MEEIEGDKDVRSAYDDAVAMSQTIRDLLFDEKMLTEIINSLDEKKRPPYWGALSRKDGISAVVMAQLLKAMGGDTHSATFLAKYGWGDKLQVDVSDFYKDTHFVFDVVDAPKELEEVVDDVKEEDNDESGESRPTESF